MIYPNRFGGIPSTGSRDIMGTRICHANADTNGIRTETNMPTFTLVGGHNLCKFGANQDNGSLDFSFIERNHISKSSFDLEIEVKVTKT